MIDLGASIRSAGLREGVAWETAPGWLLRYECFLGDVRFVAGTADFSTQWGWVPVWDVALALVHLLEHLEPGASAQFEFTESEAAISLVRNADRVHVAATYTDSIASVDFNAFLRAVRSFATDLGHQLVTAHPALQRNVDFTAALEQIKTS